MNLENAHRLNAALRLILARIADVTSDEGIAARAALTLAESELLSLGWKNDTDDLPAMQNANEWLQREINAEPEHFDTEHIHTAASGRHFRHGDGKEVDGNGDVIR